MKKQVYLLLLLLCLPLLTIAQTTVNASEIIAKINRGEAVNYKNAEITGDLDMTRLQNMKLKDEKAGKHDTKMYVSKVTAPVVFENCTFKGNVLAYVNPNEGLNKMSDPGEVYNADFEKEVRFVNCTFEEKAAFKYSHFKEDATFAGSRFSEEALFKYTDFRKAADFSKATFKDAANFKYVTFPAVANFKGAVFSEEADFKYAQFKQKADLQQATFNGLANFKYAKFSETPVVKSTSFKGNTDFKYTKLNNQSVDLAALQQRN